MLNILYHKGKERSKIYESIINSWQEQLKNKGMTIYMLLKETGMFEATSHSMHRGKKSSSKLDNAARVAKVLEIELNKFKE